MKQAREGCVADSPLREYLRTLYNYLDLNVTSTLIVSEHTQGFNMKYTIKQLAEYSGVSTRTLRYYDNIGLLAPAFYSDSGYRYYGEKELLFLQQILFFRELGFELKHIINIMRADEFDQIHGLSY